MKAGLVAVVIVCTVLVLVSNKSSGKNASVEYRAQETLNGLFNYYWKQDYLHKGVQFIFVCAQIGGISTPGKCSCNHPKSCVNCYRWWSAVALESVATYGIYTHSTNHSDMPDMFFHHSPYNANWNATAACTYIDDFTWYGIAYLKVYEWLNVSPVVSFISCLFCRTLEP